MIHNYFLTDIQSLTLNHVIGDIQMTLRHFEEVSGETDKLSMNEKMITFTSQTCRILTDKLSFLYCILTDKLSFLYWA